MRVRIKKICMSEDGKQKCAYQDTKVCSMCSVFAGQRYHSPEKRKCRFKGVNIK